MVRLKVFSQVGLLVSGRPRGSAAPPRRGDRLRVLVGYLAGGPLKDRTFTAFKSDTGQDAFSLSISYWLTSDIPTEDNAELLGAYADQSLLQVGTDDTAGRLNLAFDNGLSTGGTGLDTLGRRFMNMLSKPLDSLPWSLYEQWAAASPVSGGEQEAVEESQTLENGGLRLYELNHTERSLALRNLLGTNRLLLDVEVYWLSTLDPAPKELMPKVIASARESPSVACEALPLFRRCRPDLADSEPVAGTACERVTWWLTMLQKAQESPSA